MRRTRILPASIGLVLLVAHTPCLAQYVCGPQWLENMPPIDGTVFSAITWDADAEGPNPPLLVLGGSFSTVGGVAASSIAAFDGVSFSPLGSGTNGTVWALAVYDGDLIASGSFTNAGGIVVNCVARWDGASWCPLGNGLNIFVYALAVYNGELYAGGTFVVNGVQSIARWDGSNWVGVGGGMAIENCPGAYCGTSIQTLATYNGELVAGGYFTKAGDITARYIARWNGSHWSSLGGGFDNQVWVLKVINGQLVIGGVFQRAAYNTVTVSRIAVWNGSSWSALGGGVDGLVMSLAEHNGHLFAGGHFNTAGGAPVGHIAEWNGTAWSPLGSGLNIGPRALAVFDGDLIAGGEFTTAGGGPSLHWARWRDPLPPQIASQPVGQATIVGQDVHFSVAGSGVLPLQYQWQRNGVPLADGGRISGAQTSELTISAAEKTDAGWYDVVLTDCKSTTSSGAYLSVSCPLTITMPPAPQAVTVGEAAMFSVSVIGATGTPSFVWRRNNVPVVDDGLHIFGSASATLLISPARMADAGSYSVVITDDCGSVTSPSVVLTVTCPAMVAPDLDRDCDVDLTDLTTFVSCAAGPAVPPGSSCPFWPNNRKRAVADFDWDDDVDQEDFGVFQRCITPPNVPPDPGC